MNLLIRADASGEIGTGHVMRCLALAQAWQERGGVATFVSAELPLALEARLRAEAMQVIALSAPLGGDRDAAETIQIAQNCAAMWIVTDGYRFGAEYQQRIKDAGLRLLCVDDHGHAGHYCADLVLNQNIHAEERLYADRHPSTRILLGTRYALLRREFWPWRGWRRDIAPLVRKVLVTLGGADPDNVTLKVIRAVQQVAIPDLEVLVVIGASNRHYESLQGAVREHTQAIRLERNVTDMPELIAWADIALTAGGSTCWELALMGLPSIAVVLADNQARIVNELVARGVMIGMGWHSTVTPEDVAKAITQLVDDQGTREAMSRRGHDLVDGDGSARVVKWMMNEPLSLRTARATDSQLLWKWANDPQVRAVSFQPVPIPWEQHIEWFDRKLKDPDCVLYIAEATDSEAIGQIRFDKTADQATISISLDAAFRGMGYGSALIRRAARALFMHSDITAIHAYVKLENKASIHAFLRAGFRDTGIVVIQESQALHFVLDKHEVHI